jgi:hypothetical protein
MFIIKTTPRHPAQSCLQINAEYSRYRLFAKNLDKSQNNSIIWLFFTCYFLGGFFVEGTYIYIVCTYECYAKLNQMEPKLFCI